MNVKIVRLFLYFSLCCFFLSTAWSTNTDAEIRTILNGKINFRAQDATLQEIVEEIYDKFAIETRGLENRANEKITFVFAADSTEKLLKSLLRHLGIKNYAFEFTDAALKRLVVLPEATGDRSEPNITERAVEQQEEFVSVAQIQSVVEPSQAQAAGLQEGDIIIEYDGVRIASARQLVNEVEKKSANSQVEMVFVRQKIPTRLTLGGGFIGVRIITKKISIEEFNSFNWPE